VMTSNVNVDCVVSVAAQSMHSCLDGQAAMLSQSHHRYHGWDRVSEI